MPVISSLKPTTGHDDMSTPQGDGKRVQAAINEIRGELKVLRSAVMPEAGGGKVANSDGTNDAGTTLPPVKVPPHMTS